MALLDVEKALEEGQVERASFGLCAQAGDWEDRSRHFCEGETCRQEALEHAAMGDDWRSLLPHPDAEATEARAVARAMRFAKPRARACSRRRSRPPCRNAEQLADANP